RPDERGDKRKHQKAMCYRFTAWHLRLRPSHIDMYPLVIAGRVGKLVDHALIDLHPFGNADLPTDKRWQGVKVDYHSRLLGGHYCTDLRGDLSRGRYHRPATS